MVSFSQDQSTACAVYSPSKRTPGHRTTVLLSPETPFRFSDLPPELRFKTLKEVHNSAYAGDEVSPTDAANMKLVHSEADIALSDHELMDPRLMIVETTNTQDLKLTAKGRPVKKLEDWIRRAQDYERRHGGWRVDPPCLNLYVDRTRDVERVLGMVTPEGVQDVLLVQTSIEHQFKWERFVPHFAYLTRFTYRGQLAADSPLFPAGTQLLHLVHVTLNVSVFSEFAVILSLLNGTPFLRDLYIFIIPPTQGVKMIQLRLLAGLFHHMATLPSHVNLQSLAIRSLYPFAGLSACYYSTLDRQLVTMAWNSFASIAAQLHTIQLPCLDFGAYGAILPVRAHRVVVEFPIDPMQHVSDLKRVYAELGACIQMSSTLKVVEVRLNKRDWAQADGVKQKLEEELVTRGVTPIEVWLVVKRLEKPRSEAMSMLKSCTILLVGSLGRPQKDITAELVQHGATIAKKAQEATHAIASPADWDAQKPKAKQVTAENERRAAAGEEEVWVVGIEWLDECIKKKKKVAEKDFVLGGEEEEEEAPAPASKAKAKGKATGKGKGKRARDSPEPEEEEQEEEEEEEEAPVVTKMVKTIAKGSGPPVDDRFPHKSTTHVLADAAGVFYDATLNQTDLKSNANKFYLIQVLKSDTGNQYWAFNVWGRVGENGQNKVIGPFSSPGSAIQDFQKKFKDKTKLDWSNRLGPTSAGKYTYLERSFDADEDEQEEVVTKGKSKGEDGHAEKKARTDKNVEHKSLLDERVQSLMQMIFNTSTINQTMTQFEYDANKLPLGKLAKSTMDRGLLALKEIAAILSGPPPHSRAEIERLTNQYYTLIPHAYGRMKPPMIDNKERLKKELELIEALTEMKITSELMKTVEKGDEDLHPLDSQFKNLGLNKLEPIDDSSAEFSTLVKLLANTKGHTHNMWNLELKDAFKVEREEDWTNYQSGGWDALKKGEKRLLWHGSRSSNYGGILSQGLRIAPPEAPVSGYMFGKGAYLASMCSKSAQYCYHSISNDEGLLMLIEAQLGPKPFYQREQAEYEAQESCRKANMQCTWGIGRTQPGGWEDASVLSPELKGIQMPSTTIPPGEINKTSSLLYDEFIVYNVAQVKIRYLLRVKFQNTARGW